MLAWAGDAVPAIVELRVRFPTGDVDDDMATFRVDYIDALAAAAGNAKGDTLVNDLIGGSLVVVSWTRFEVSTRFCNPPVVRGECPDVNSKRFNSRAAIYWFDGLRGAHADARGGASAA